MSMQKIKMPLIILLAAVIFTTAGARIYAINREFPAVMVTKAHCGESIETKGLSITMKSCEILALSEFSQSYTDPCGGNFDEEKMLVFNIDIENVSDKEINLPIYEFSAESKAWRNGIDPIAFKEANPGMSLMQSLKPEEGLSVYLTYALYQQNFRAEEWAGIESREFSCVWLDYPSKIVLTMW